jgi:hypothetical protein
MLLARLPSLRGSSFRVLGVAAPLLLTLLGIGPCERRIIKLGLPTLAGALPVAITLPSRTDPADATVALDGVDVTASFSAGGGGLVGSVPVPAPGRHRITVSRPFSTLPGLSFLLTSGRRFDAPDAAPALLSAEPPAGGGNVPRTAWLRFRLATPIPDGALDGFGFALECNGSSVRRSAHALGDGSLVLNPTPELPAGASCRVVWRGSDGNIAESRFEVAANAAGGGAVALYDRTDPLALAPFPDDYYVVPDAEQPSGVSIDMPVPPFTEAFQAQAFTSLVAQTTYSDGWSRMTHVVLAFSHPLDPSAVPANETESQDPFAPIALIDVDPASPSFGDRIPYRIVLRSDAAPDGSFDHTAMLFPSIDLREHGRYAVVVTKRAFAAGEPGRPIGPSNFFSTVLAATGDGEAPEVTQTRDKIEPALATVASLADVPIPAEDIAVAVQLSIRTQPGVEDSVYFKERALSLPPPQLVLPTLANPCPNVNNFCIRLVSTRALEIRGRVRLPEFRNPGLLVFQRDENGVPVQTGTNEVPFMMTLPVEALDGPVPIVMYQHGNPGGPIEATRDSGTGYLDDAGYAVAGIQDTLNRQIGQDVAKQVTVILFFAVQTQQMPDYWAQTGADMIGFLRAIQGMGSLDLLHRDALGNPAIGPDGIPEIDTTRILYHGISEGGNNAQRFLPFAPEIIAATPTVGGARLGETLIHQSSDSILAQIGGFMPELRPVDLWAGLALFQLGFDPQDGHTFLKYLYREPLLPFVGSTDVTPPSALFTEGVGDSLVPNNASRSMAAELGIPHVRPIARNVPALVQVDAPVAENLAPGLTSGYFQYDPATTPYCVTRPQPEGHYCPQSAPEAQAQRRHFLESALEGAAEIVSPF